MKLSFLKGSCSFGLLKDKYKVTWNTNAEIQQWILTT